MEALKRGYRVAGFEISPFAALVCRTKLGAAGWEKDSFAAVIQRFRQYMRRKARSGTARPKSRPPAHFRTNRPFFSPAVERQVLFVQDFINVVSAGPAKGSARRGDGELLQLLLRAQSRHTSSGAACLAVEAIARLVKAKAASDP